MSEWSEHSLQNLVSFQKGKKVETSPFQLPGLQYYLGAGSLVGGYDGYASTFLSVQANNNDVLMLWDGERSGLVGHDLVGVVSSTVSKLTPNEKIKSGLLYYYLLHNFEWIQNRRTGTGVPHVPKDLGRILVLRYPKDINIQNRISVILGAIDQVIENTGALVEKYQRVKAGLMHDLFARGITADGKIRPPREEAPGLYKKTSVGWIPKDWECTTMGKYIEKNLYGPRFDASYYSDSGNVKTIRGTDFSKDGKILYSQVPVARLATIKIAQHILKDGDVVIVTTADCGLTAVFETQEMNYIPSAYTVKYKFSNSIYPYFIKYFMQTFHANKQVNKYVRQGTLGNLPGSDLLRFLIALPSKNEQIEIADRLDVIGKKIDKEKYIIEKLCMQRSGLMSDLLTGEVEVKVDESEAAYV